MGQGLAGATFGSGQKHPLILIHGFPLDGRMWEGQEEALAVDRRVLVPDLRGFGRSPLPREGHTIEDHARDIAEFMDAHAAPRGILCGFSMGGYVALAFAAFFPWRLSGLVLADTKAGSDLGQAREARTASAQRVLGEGLTFLADDMLFKLLTEQTLASDEELARRIWSLMVSQRREGVASALLAMRDRPDRTDQLARIDCPALVVVGNEDVITPPCEAQKMAASLPKGCFREIPEAGHLSNMEQPFLFNGALLDFMSALPD
jgi:pimeloyl-ACP methyl ester carboxylesterase